jgi:hypothetical protein
MAELNAAYRVAREHLRRTRASSGGRRSESTPPTAPETRVEGWRSAWAIPRVRPPAFDERLGSTVGRILLTTALAASAGEIARRIVPAEWDLAVSLTTAAAIALSAAIVFRRRA